MPLARLHLRGHIFDHQTAFQERSFPEIGCKKQGFATRAIHSGQEPDPLTGAVTVPIYPTSTYVQQEIGKHKGYEYARVSNPTRDRLEDKPRRARRRNRRAVFASGMAAINAIATMLKSGDHVVCGHDLYGGTPRLFNQVLASFGLEFTYVDTSDAQQRGARDSQEHAHGLSSRRPPIR